MLGEVSIFGKHDGVFLVQAESTMNNVRHRRLEVYEEYPILYRHLVNASNTVPVLYCKKHQSHALKTLVMLNGLVIACTLVRR